MTSDEPADDTDDCEACRLTHGRAAVPGGRIHETGHWLVEHCVGPLGLGTLIVKPFRHVTTVADLDDAETAELGPLIRRASDVARQLTPAEQVYNCLWSHAGGRPVHIHYVIQPITNTQMEHFGAHGPALQVAMFEAGEHPQAVDIDLVADRARDLFAAG